ncbi:MAG: PIG-L family deacetylase [Candidatus Korarchaeota archaeon]|nr:PIG-L family deacetylase [Candidatus Korarchaeota archaeon]
MKIEFKKLLFVGPHPDDVELGCGGLMSKYSKSAQMTYLILSPCLEDPKNKNILDEVREAISILGLSTESLVIENLPRRTFHDQRKKIREILISVREKYKPDIAFCPSIKDVHQDHSVAAEETLRLFRDVGVISYEAPRSSLIFKPNLYVEISEENLKTKIKALMRFKSQFDRYYFKPEIIQSFSRMRGSQCKVNYAEAFEALRMKV